jgi:hypothetical protein
MTRHLGMMQAEEGPRTVKQSNTSKEQQRMKQHDGGLSPPQASMPLNQDARVAGPRGEATNRNYVRVVNPVMWNGSLADMALPF